MRVAVATYWFAAAAAAAAAATAATHAKRVVLVVVGEVEVALSTCPGFACVRPGL